MTFRNLGQHILAIILLLSAGLANAEESPADVRLLIDISGSMKANDPANLRVPAVNLMIDLLPEGSKAGVWTFAKEVNMLVPHGEVNEAWRNKARMRVQEINSVGLYTDIGAVLDTASFDRKIKDRSRHMILLTDGMVDISKDKARDETERERIISQQLPELAESGFILHPIALSDNSDKELMDTLAIESGGFSSQANTADELSRLFLKALDQSAPAEEVPLNDNAFLIDSSVDEFTLLAFKEKPDDVVRLLSPSEQVIDQQNLAEGVRWHSTSGYELITVPQPYEGEWILQSELMPDNRVSVVSNLKMDVSRLPSNAYLGEKLELTASFNEQGKLLADPEFLRVVKLSAEVSGSDGLVDVHDADQQGYDNAGVYHFTLPSFPAPGNYQVSVLADGQTFNREFRQQVSVRKPFQFNVELVRGDGPDKLLVEAIPRSQTIDRIATEVFARVQKPDGNKQLRGVDLDEDGRRWSFYVDALIKGEYKIRLRVSGLTTEGKKFELSSDTMLLRYPEEASVNSEGTVAEEPAVKSVEPPNIVSEAISESPLEDQALVGEPENTIDESELPSEAVAVAEDTKPELNPEPEAEPTPEEVAGNTEVSDTDEEDLPAKDETAEPAVDTEEATEPENQEPSKLWLYLGLVLGNLLLIGGLAFVYFKFVRTPKPGSDAGDELEKSEPDDQADAGPR